MKFIFLVFTCHASFLSALKLHTKMQRTDNLLNMEELVELEFNGFNESSVREIFLSSMSISEKRVQIKTWIGRLGNNIIQLSNAIEIAEAHGATVVFPSSGRFFQAFETKNSPAGSPHWRQIFVKQLDKKANCTAPPGKFYPYFDYGIGECFTTNERHRVMQTYLKPLLKQSHAMTMDEDLTKVDPKELVIHLRCGDIFKPNIRHGQTQQPPCAAYDKVIHREGFSKVRVIVNKKSDNPCLRTLKERHPNVTVNVQSLSEVEDWTTLKNARNIFVAYSTFSSTAYTFSEEVKNLFVMKGASFLNEPLAGSKVTAFAAPHQSEVMKMRVSDRVKWMIETSEKEIILTSGL